MSKHNFIYDPHCSRCGADGSEVDAECPGDIILAAAHRAGAREALDAVRRRFATAWESAAHAFYSHSSGFREIHERACICAIAEIDNEIARYAEPGEEQKG